MWTGSPFRDMLSKLVSVLLYVKTYMFTLHVAVNTCWTYTTELSSDWHAATSCAHLLHPCQRASCHGLQVRSTWYRRNVYVYILYVIVLLFKRRGLQTRVVSLRPTSFSQFWSWWGLPRDTRGLADVTDLSAAILCCHFWMFSETAAVGIIPVHI